MNKIDNDIHRNLVSAMIYDIRVVVFNVIDDDLNNKARYILRDYVHLKTYKAVSIQIDESLYQHRFL